MTPGRILVLVAVALAAAGRALAQQSAPAIPERIVVTPPEAPLRMLPDDARRFLGALRAAAPAPPALPPPPATGVSRTITVEPRAVANRSSEFLFRDVTERTVPATRSLAERRAAVEVYRQSIATSKRRHR
jgi:hypothetical protein